MPAPACFIRTDLSELTLFLPERDESWRPTPPAEDHEPAAADLIARSREAASWTASQPGVRRRIALACLDVDDTVCTWMRASSTNPQVLAAAFRNLVSEWKDAVTGRSIVPLAVRDQQATTGRRRPFSRRSEPQRTGRKAFPVLALPDALPRLWLDQLDRMNVRVGPVVTLWHAMAMAWASDGERSSEVVALVLQRSPTEFVWAWHRAGGLLAGGAATAPVEEAGATAEDPQPVAVVNHDALAQRLALDWLTWSTQLGATPDRLVIVAPRPEALADPIRKRRSDLPIDSIAEENPVRAAVTIAAERATQGAAQASALPTLSERPTRAVRKRYQLGAAALALLSVASIGLGWQLRGGAARWSAAASEIRQATRDRVAQLGDQSLLAGDPYLMLQSRYAELQKRPEVEPPDPPPPIFEEMRTVLDVLTREEYAEFVLQSLNFDGGGQAQLTVTAPDREKAISLGIALDEASEHASWERDRRTSGDRVKYLGDWNRRYR